MRGCQEAKGMLISEEEWSRVSTIKLFSELNSD